MRYVERAIPSQNSFSKRKGMRGATLRWSAATFCFEVKGERFTILETVHSKVLDGV
jgi:hypothetical protein